MIITSFWGVVIVTCFARAALLSAIFCVSSHMPELRSGIVAALLENLYKVHSLCKHNCEISISSLIAAVFCVSSHMPELRSGIVAALLKCKKESNSSCKHDYSFLFCIFIAARAKRGRRPCQAASRKRKCKMKKIILVIYQFRKRAVQFLVLITGHLHRVILL